MPVDVVTALKTANSLPKGQRPSPKQTSEFLQAALDKDKDIFGLMQAMREAETDPTTTALFLGSLAGESEKLGKDYESERTRLGSAFDPARFFADKAIEYSGKVGQKEVKEDFFRTEGQKSAFRNFMIGAGKSFNDLWVRGPQQIYAETVGTKAQAQDVKQQAQFEQRQIEGLQEQSPVSVFIGQMVGAVGAAAPTMALPAGKGTMARLATGSAIGAGEALLEPVTGEESFLTQKAEQAVYGAGFGAAFPVLETLYSKRPIKGAMQWLINKNKNTPETVKGQQLSEVVDNLLTPGEETGSSMLLGLENFASQYAPVRDRVVRHYAQLVDATVNNAVKPFINMISSTADLSNYAVGRKLQQVTRNALTSLDEARHLQAVQDYALVQELAGPNFKVPLENYRAALLELINNGKNQPSTSDAAKIARQAQAYLDQITVKTKGAAGRGKTDQLSTITGKPVKRPVDVEPTGGAPGRGVQQRINPITGRPMARPSLSERSQFPNLNQMDLLRDTERVSGVVGGIPKGQQRSVVTGRPVQGEATTPQTVGAIPSGPRIDLVSGKTVDTAEMGLVDAQKARRNFGRGAQRQTNPFADVHPNESRAASAKLFSALDNDMAQAAENVGSPQIKEAFDAANKNYQKFSNTISAIEASALRKVLGDDVAANLFTEGFNEVAPEIAMRRLKSSTFSELGIVRDVLSRVDGGEELLKDLRANYIADALEQAIEKQSPEMVEKGIGLNIGALRAALPKKGAMQALGATDQELDALAKNVALLSRQMQRFGLNSSGTNIQAETAQMVTAMAQLLTGVKAGAISVAGKIVSLSAVVDAMMQPETTKTLRLLAKPNASIVDLERAATVLMTDYATEEQ